MPIAIAAQNCRFSLVFVRGLEAFMSTISKHCLIAAVADMETNLDPGPFTLHLSSEFGSGFPNSMKVNLEIQDLQSQARKAFLETLNENSTQP